MSADALVRRAMSAGHASASYAPGYGRHSLLCRSLIAPSQREPCPLQQDGGSPKRSSAGSPLHSKGADARPQTRGARTGAREDRRFPQRKSSCDTAHALHARYESSPSAQRLRSAPQARSGRPARILPHFWRQMRRRSSPGDVWPPSPSRGAASIHTELSSHVFMAQSPVRGSDFRKRDLEI